MPTPNVRLLCAVGIAAASSVAAADVPPVCADKFFQAGAAPGSDSCYIDAITAPSNLSNFFCDTHAADYCTATPEPSEEDQADAANAGPSGDCGAGGAPTEGNPIHVGTGNKYQREVDLAGWSPFAAPLVRHYNSRRERRDGSHWGHTWQRRLAVDGFEFRDDAGELQYLADTVALVRPGGRNIIFYRTNGNELAATAAETPEDIPAVGTNQHPLEWSGSEWRYRNAAGELEYYDGQGRLTRITDRRGFTRTVERDADGRVARVIDPFGRTLTFAYDSAGRLTRVTDPAGARVTYGYDADGRLTRVTDREGATRHYHYGENGAPVDALTGITDENGNRFASWTYDAQGRAITSEHAGGAERVEIDYRADGTVHVVDANGGERTYTLETVRARKLAGRIDGDGCGSCGDAREREYDERGLVTRAVDAEGNVTTYAYNAAGLESRRTEAVGTAAERTITTEWDTDLRRPLTVTEPGRSTDYSYDGRGRMTAVTVTDTATGATRTTTYGYHPDAADGTPGRLATVDGPRTDVADITTFAYDQDGNRTTITNALGHVTGITEHDAYGRPTEVVDPNGLATRLAYDGEGRLIERDRGGRLTTFAYDAVGNLTRITRPTGAELHYEYDAAQRLTAIEDEQGHRVEYGLDAAGNRTEQRVSAASGRVAREHRQVFDALGRLIQSIGAQGQTTTYQYDQNDNRTRTTDAAGAATTRAFDALDRVIRQTDAMGGMIAFAYDDRDRVTAVTDPNGNTTRYTYNGFGDRIEVDSPDAGVTTYAYNEAGQRISETDARGQTTAYTRDALGRRTEAHYADGTRTAFTYDEGPNAIGRLSRIEESSATTEWRYNDFGEVTARTQRSDGAELTTTHEYDAAGRRIAMVYPSGTRVTYTHAADEITGIRVNGQPVLEGIDYEPFGPVNGWTWGDGERHTRSFDRDGRLITHAMPDGQRMLSYSADGRVTGITGPNVIRSHGYDALDRLTRTDGTDGTWTYQYDANGNRLGKTHDGETESYTYATDSNRLRTVVGASENTYTHDAAGHMTGDGEHAYDWDARGRMSEVDGGATAEYRYNALGQRILKRARRAGEGPDYAALAEQAELQADALQGEAETLQAQSTQARQAAAEARNEAARARAERNRANARAQRHQRAAQRHHRTAERWQGIADRYSERAERYRERISDSAGNWWQYLRNRIYRTLADLHERIADWYRGWADGATASAEAAQERAEQARAAADAAGERLAEAEADAAAEAQRAEDLQQQATTQRQAAAEQRQQAAEYRRLAEEESGPQTETTRFVYGPNDRLLGRYNEDGQAEREYIRLGTTPVAAVDADGAIHYIHTDHLGTPRAVSEPDGEVVWRWISSPFGDTKANNDPDGDGEAFTLRLRFPGQYHDPETGRHYNYFRKYDPGIGRYVSSDPIGFAGGDTNLFGYVLNDPVNWTDPNGARRVHRGGQGTSGNPRPGGQSLTGRQGTWHAGKFYPRMGETWRAREQWEQFSAADLLPTPADWYEFYEGIEFENRCRVVCDGAGKLPGNESSMCAGKNTQPPTRSTVKSCRLVCGS